MSIDYQSEFSRKRTRNMFDAMGGNEDAARAVFHDIWKREADKRRKRKAAKAARRRNRR